MMFRMAPVDIVSLVLEEEMMNQSSIIVAPLVEEVEMPFYPDQKHELTPPRDRYSYDSGYKEVTAFLPMIIIVQAGHPIIGLRDKPIAQQDALLRSEFQPRYLPGHDPLSH
ncbi:hypothetical protein GQ457_02G024360 [Hibiscus cannabinus]